jgi:hypothetical protein
LGYLNWPLQGILPNPSQRFQKSDVQLINGRLIFVWSSEEKIHIWDAEKGGLLLEGRSYRTWRTSGYQGMDPEFFPWMHILFMPILSRQERGGQGGN